MTGEPLTVERLEAILTDLWTGLEPEPAKHLVVAKDDPFSEEMRVGADLRMGEWPVTVLWVNPARTVAIVQDR